MNSAQHIKELKKLIDRWVDVEGHASNDPLGQNIELLTLALENSIMPESKKASRSSVCPTPRSSPLFSPSSRRARKRLPPGHPTPSPTTRIIGIDDSFYAELSDCIKVNDVLAKATFDAKAPIPAR